jgi:AP-4 complex subunit epsilon-1
MLSSGAKPYIHPSERIHQTIQFHDSNAAAIHSLWFDPYETPQLPLPTISPAPHNVDGHEGAKSSIPAYSQPLHSSAMDAAISTEVARLHLEGVQKKWGQSTYSSSSASIVEKTTTGSTLDNDKRKGSTIHVVQEPHMNRNKQPEISPEKRKLAASLFGGGALKAEGNGKGLAKNQKAVKNTSKTDDNQVQTTLPPLLPDLLDWHDDVPAALSSRDPLNDLGLVDLTEMVPSSDPVPPTAVLSMDIFSLYDGSTASSENSGHSTTATVDLMAEITPAKMLENPSAHGFLISSGITNAAPKKGPSIQTSIQKDARSRQVGVNPTGPNPHLFKDLLN